MPKPLPSTVDAHKLAKQAVIIDGDLVLDNMLRLKESLSDDLGQVAVELKFDIGEDYLHYVHGHMKGELQLLCQRCM